MRKAELDIILNTILDIYPESTAISFVVGEPMKAEINEKYWPVPVYPPIESLTPYQLEMISLNLLNEQPAHVSHLVKNSQCEFVYALGDRAILKGDVFQEGKHLSVLINRIVRSKK